jgi:hypothetical protein
MVDRVHPSTYAIFESGEWISIKFGTWCLQQFCFIKA